MGNMLFGNALPGGGRAKLFAELANDPAALAAQPAPEAAPAAAPAAPAMVATNVLLNPAILQLFARRTASQVARDAIKQLSDAAKETLEEAINTVTNSNIQPSSLMDQLERKTRIGEVLNAAAATWSNETRDDFATAFNMDKARLGEKLGVMDSIVSLAILNNPQLDDQLRAETFSEPTQEELLNNRKIIAQFPPPGTPLSPPYIIVVVVEHQDVEKASGLIDELIGSLATHQGFRLPSAAVAKITGQLPGLGGLRLDAVRLQAGTQFIRR